MEGIQSLRGQDRPAGALALSFRAPGRSVFQDPINQGAFKTDVVTSFLALDPFVRKDLLAFGAQNFLPTL